MKGRVNTGGGIGKAFAAIGVTYPAGASCTCTLDSKVLKAPDTSGTALFVIPYAGEWVVTISQSGEEPVSETVNVTESKAYTVTLTFELWLYSPGNTHDEITGGWIGIGKAIVEGGGGGHPTTPSIIKTDESLAASVSGGEYLVGAVTISNKVNLEKYKTLQIKYAGISSLIEFRVWSSIGTYLNDNIAAATTLSTSETTASIDVSDLSGDYIIGFTLNSSRTNSANLNLVECYLE